MKNNKIVKFLLSLLITLTIISTNTEVTLANTPANYDSTIEFLGEEPEKSPFVPWEKQ